MTRHPTPRRTFDDVTQPVAGRPDAAVVTVGSVDGVRAAPVAIESRLGYRPALDGVRALAVLAVVAVHVTYLLIPEWAGRWVPGGFLGVDVFFVLSGFLITTLLLEEHRAGGAISVPAFYARRAFRLLPAVGALLAVHSLLAIATHADLGLEARTTAAVGLYSLNWVEATGGAVAAGLSHLWSLSVEEQFYFVWPVVLIFALRRSRPTRLIVGVAIAGILWATGERAWLWIHGAGWETIYVRTDARVDELLMGVLLAVGFHQGWRLPHRWRHLGTAGLVVLAVCVARVPRESRWLFVGGGFTVVGLASVLLIASLLNADVPLSRAFTWRPAVRLGRASYSLYLWHAPIFIAVASHFAARPAAERLFVGLVGAGTATSASYLFVEQPIARMRRRYRASRVAGRAPDPGPAWRQPMVDGPRGHAS
jgi:peptidoglycan/LPS O-acetylase OafA/YrhL